MNQYIHQKRSALMIIDVQGQLAQSVYQAEQNLRQTCRLVQITKALKMPVYYVEHCAERLGPTTDALVKLLDNAVALNKQTFSLWQQDEIAMQLTNSDVTHWIVCGIECHVCVYQSVCDLLQHPFDVTVIQDAVSSRSESDMAVGLAAMRDRGAMISSVEMFAFEMMGTPQHPAFKQVLKLIK